MLNPTENIEAIRDRLRNLDKTLTQTLTEYSQAVTVCHALEENNQASTEQLALAHQHMQYLSEQIMQLRLMLKEMPFL